MSIKIYDGLKATNGNNPFKIAKEIRKVMEPIFFQNFKKIYTDYKNLLETGEIVRWSDLNYFYGDDTHITRPAALDFDLYRKIESLNKIRTHSFSDADICYHVSLIENAIEGENPLILIYGENSDMYRESLITAGVAEKYGYWDNVDEDETVSKEDWNTRGKAWGNLLGDAAPSQIELGISYPSSIQTAMSLQGFR